MRQVTHHDLIKEVNASSRVMFRAKKTGLSPAAIPNPTPNPSSFPTDRSKAGPLVQFIFLCICDVICGVCGVLICSSSISFAASPESILYKSIAGRYRLFFFFFFFFGREKSLFVLNPITIYQG